MSALLEMQGVTKSFPGVQALRGIHLTLHSGEILALMGENGAGKSTLLKTLGGVHSPDAGQIQIEGSPVDIRTPIASRRAGIAIIHQEFNLIPSLSVRENIFLGRERSTAGFIHAETERRRCEELLERLGMKILPHTLCGRLSVAQQQSVEIAKALAENARILVMDEPTAALNPQEVERLLAIVQELKQQGIGIIYVSHRLDEVFQIADRIMVMRDGTHVTTRPKTEVTRRELIEWMVGRTLESEFPPRSIPIGEPRLIVRGLTRGDRVRDVSFHVRRGEILVLTGLVGAGRTETARLLFGADQADSGEVLLDGRLLKIRSPRDAIRAGLCLLTEDRKHQGLILGHTVLENFGLPNLSAFSSLGFLRPRDERDAFARYVKSLRIKTPNDRQKARNLSGGNQQKVVLAKWLQAHSEVLIFDEPTRGIDIGAKQEIYQLLNDLATQGKAILMISSDLPEVLGMADRILVMRAGRISGEITDVRAATQSQLLELAVH